MDKDRKVSCKGVVFNEMKGVFSSPDAQLQYEADRRLFPDTCYHWVSGGDPEYIPDLSYEAFAQAHRDWYHPSNAFFFLDGALDLDKVLTILDEEYLAGFGRHTPPAPVPLQAPVDGGSSTLDYALGPQESPEGRYWLGLGYGAGTFRDRARMTALQALCDVLCGDNEAPLRRRLLGAGLARDVTMQLNNGVLQPTVLLTVKNCAGDRLEEAAGAVEAELTQLARKGLDHRRILATLDNLEFNQRERQGGWMPQGLLLATQVYGSWMYGGDPAAHLCVEPVFRELRSRCEEGYFEQLLQEVFLENGHRCRVILRPSATLGAERAAREARRIQARTETWAEETWAQVRQLQVRTETWQSTPDTPEALAAIPRLRPDQIPPEPEHLPAEPRRTAGLPVLVHPLPTHGITYLNLCFDLNDLDGTDLCAASFLCELLGALETASTPAAEISEKIRSCFGSLQSRVEAYGEAQQFDRCRTFLCVSASMLNQKVGLGARMRTLMQRLFTRARLTVSITSDDGQAAETAAGVLAGALPAGAPAAAETSAVTLPPPAREGFILPADISFAAMSAPFPEVNRGAARVMKRVVYLEHLWNGIRVRGGAYGTGMVLRNNGLVSLYSYRDPSAAHSLACYRAIPDFLERFDGDVEGAVIGAVAESDPLLTPRDKGKTADARYWKKLSDSDLCRTRREILAARSADVAAYAGRMQDCLEQGAVCVLGPRSQLEACGTELDNILSL